MSKESKVDCKHCGKTIKKSKLRTESRFIGRFVRMIKVCPFCNGKIIPQRHY